MSALTDAVDEFVVPFYLLVLHANYLDEGPTEQTNFIGATRRAMANITDAALELLLNSGGWREMLAASWFIGLSRRGYYVDWLGDLLVESRTCYAGQGLCFALARFCSQDAAQYLRSHLDKYLPIGGRQWDQEWAIGALAWIDRVRSSNFASAYLNQPDAWNVLNGENVVVRLESRGAVSRFANVMEFCLRHFDVAASGSAS